MFCLLCNHCYVAEYFHYLVNLTVLCGAQVQLRRCIDGFGLNELGAIIITLTFEHGGHDSVRLSATEVHVHYCLVVF
jgi:hypothetical protein